MSERITALGGTVFFEGAQTDESDNRRFLKSLDAFLVEHSDYQIVHIHSGDIYTLLRGPQIAQKRGVSIRIAHSYCEGINGVKNRIIKGASALIFRRYTFAFTASSISAAKLTFPDEVTTAGKFAVIKKAVDLDEFHYDQSVRESARGRYSAGENVILGYIGPISERANLRFLVDVFEAYHFRNHHSRLWLVGSGDEEKEILKYVEERGLVRSVRFFDFRNDLSELMNAMDVLVLPGLFESNSICAAQAHACSLPVVASDRMKDLPLQELSAFIPLEAENLDCWVNGIEKMLLISRHDQRESMIRQGYEVTQSARGMENFYLHLLETVQ